MLEEILETYDDEDILFADGFDNAIIGVCTQSNRIVYSISKCVKILQEDMTEEEAIEYFEFNVSGAYMGEKNSNMV